jgi:hypothetical protein
MGKKIFKPVSESLRCGCTRPSLPLSMGCSFVKVLRLFLARIFGKTSKKKQVLEKNLQMIKNCCKNIYVL